MPVLETERTPHLSSRRRVNTSMLTDSQIYHHTARLPITDQRTLHDGSSRPLATPRTGDFRLLRFTAAIVVAAHCCLNSYSPAVSAN